MKQSNPYPHVSNVTILVSFLEPVSEITKQARIGQDEMSRLVTLGKQLDTVQEGLGLIVCEKFEGSLF